MSTIWDPFRVRSWGAMHSGGARPASTSDLSEARTPGYHLRHLRCRLEFGRYASVAFGVASRRCGDKTIRGAVTDASLGGPAAWERVAKRHKEVSRGCGPLTTPACTQDSHPRTATHPQPCRDSRHEDAQTAVRRDPHERSERWDQADRSRDASSCRLSRHDHFRISVR